jgi:hypothetical protein
MTAADPSTMSPSVSDPKTAVLFLVGGVVTAVFSASLDVPAVNAGMAEVLGIGMLVPSFTWLVQMSASLLTMPPVMRRQYWYALGRACAIGSFALLPAAIANLTIAGLSPWYSAANVLVCVAVMAIDVFRQCRHAGIGIGWPTSWLCTITLNMSLFAWSSRMWWAAES